MTMRHSQQSGAQFIRSSCMQRVPVRLFTVAQPLHEHALELLPDPGRDLRLSGVVDEVQISDDQT